MHTTNLRKVGGSTMLAIPPAILDVLNLQPGTTVGLSIDHGQLIVKPSPRPHYNLEDLLAQCDTTAEITPEDRTWVNDKPVGDELL